MKIEANIPSKSETATSSVMPIAAKNEVGVAVDSAGTGHGEKSNLTKTSTIKRNQRRPCMKGDIPEGKAEFEPPTKRRRRTAEQAWSEVEG